MSTATQTLSHSINDKLWSRPEKFIFRVAFIFFILLIVPLEPEWYTKLFQIFPFINYWVHWRAPGRD
ncbi:hypothetical protein KRR40_33210 [Niabella defluvii]|nr:hypothetical protein KRR40_33210 [Niabella sp. I65]